ncbi:MAG: cob(I)yrinic acid a,c-diamide adenosyltransferase [Rhodovibrionaceae bacterium]|nr:cob(I)yrinic acid a,c-diamide adenosyltransferase [Rhodovibrionaceae bacterium]
MVQLTRIYTRGGDKGKTSLGTGQRVVKHAPRVAAYGTVDEANAVIGMAQVELSDAAARLREDVTAHLKDSGTQKRAQANLVAVELVSEILARVQNDLFDLGADLCTPEVDDPEYPPLRIAEGQVKRLESEIDQINAELKPLDSFILPGGKPAAALLHLARTVVRRAEREITALGEEEKINLEALRYVNRLSDLLFVMARYVNDRGENDVLWKPGEYR